MPHRTGFDDHSLNGRSPNDFDHVQQTKAMPPVGTHSSSAGASQVHVNDYRFALQQQSLSREEDYHRSATPDLLTAPKAPMLHRQDSTISSNHDGDSVFDLYGGGGGRMSTISAGSFVPPGGAEVFPSFVNGNDQANMASEEPDSSKWIHKDKLEEDDPVSSKWIHKEMLERDDPDSSKRIHKGKLERDEPDSSQWIHRDKLEENDPDSSKWIHRDKLAKIEADDAGGRGVYNTNVDSGTSRWIDRDKLARIESQELQRAGIVIPRSRASTSSTTYRGNENEHPRDQKKQRVASPAPIEDEDEQMLNNPNEFSNDLRTPEEQAADLISLQNMSPSRQFRRNPSYSRIPVPTASPFPIPQQYLERSAPLLRTATTPNGSDDDKASLTNTFIRSRKRSHSAGSAFLLDDPASALPAPGTISNPKNPSRTPGSPRKQSARPNSMIKQRTRSNPQLHNRPGTSASYATHLSGTGGQDSTRKHHPEGPPPWSLASYTPDPSLPPDQQIIPTVAKRMQQEQWERDGAPADVYDRNLRPLRVHGDEEVEKARHRRTLSQETQNEKPVEWPLKSASTTPPPEEPKTVRQDAGYKAMPSVSNIWAVISSLSVRTIADDKPRLMATHSRAQHQFSRHHSSSLLVWREGRRRRRKRRRVSVVV